ncbi:DUF3040 domain-containing protein [Pseudarthrobacter sp. P1]|uniref:DUF3040 domain-containing protein n=1 Tax=Pseudarthrobacter sp. P1 TaxID=3418418 RepID=UPI003CFB14B1
MGLSEHDQNIIDELERRLLAEDPEFVEGLSQPSVHRRSLRLLLCGLGFLALGIALLAIALLMHSVPLGVVAFLAMVSGGYGATLPAAMAGLRRPGTTAGSKSHSTPA